MTKPSFFILAIGAALLAASPGHLQGQTTLIASNATWRFLENGSDQGTGWTEPWYNDDDWGIGRAELGYGDDVEGRPEATVIGSAANGYITTYFRRFFFVTNAAGISNLSVRLMRDDGGVVYLNGVEIFRSGMPAGPITAQTLAAEPGASGADEFTFFTNAVDPELLFNGINLLAAEVHQRAAGSSDLSFSLELVANEVQSPPIPPDANLLRGPYLQSCTTTDIIVCWRTDVATPSRVRFGLGASDLNWEVFDADTVTDHRVTLTNLSPDTRYYYSIGTSVAVLSGGPDHYFVTAPAAPKPTRIWALGDSGTASAGSYGSWLVRDAYRDFAGDRDTDVWLMLGDNAYYIGTDQEYQAAVFETYPQFLRRFPLWPTIGNHDAATPSAYFDIFVLPTDGRAGGVASGTENYYSFDYSDIHFICIDSELSANAPGSPMLNWLEADLAANTRTWTIAYWHSPPYNFGTHNSDEIFDTAGHLVQMRERVVPILENHGIDLVLCGHSHSYERSFLLHGHHGYSTSLTPQMIRDSGSGRPEETGPYRKETDGGQQDDGAVYVVAGSSGWVTGDVRLPAYLHPAMFIKLKQLGSMVIDVDGNRLDARFLRETGAIDDHFTILKGGASDPLRFATFRIQQGQVMAQWKSVAGHTYRIQKSTSIDTPDWVNASDEITATGATSSWSDIADAGPEKTFFRVMRVGQGQ